MEGGDPTQIQNFIDLVPLPPNLACSMTSVAQTPSSAFKTNSLSRMDDLERSLSRCDEPSYTENYYNVSWSQQLRFRFHSSHFPFNVAQILNSVLPPLSDHPDCRTWQS